MPSSALGNEFTFLSEPLQLFATPEVTAYINAGGRGSRLNPRIVPDPKIGISKALLSIGEGDESIKLIDYHIARLHAHGFTRIVVGAGDHRPVVQYVEEAYDGDATVSVVSTPNQSGTAGDLYQALESKPQLIGPTVLIQNCDTLLDTNELSLLAMHADKESLLTIVTTQNTDVPNQGAFFVNNQGKVLYNIEAQTAADINTAEAISSCMRVSSCGMMVLNAAIIMELASEFDCRKSYSLYSDIMKICLKAEGVYAYDNGLRFFQDIGTPEAYANINSQPSILRDLLATTVSYSSAA